MNALQVMRAECLLAFLAGFAGLPRRQTGAHQRPVAVSASASANAAAAPLPLARAATHWVLHPRGLVVTCEAGTLWLTFDGEARDIVLATGESHRCESDARLAIHALAAAQLRLGPAPARR